ncbi:hypothetical protein PV797_01660 [Clostridiaceae bacterium M8S5]|nr:hypothetical protein PV797_01660 [Clostridiaceae bacterium M8S5]
MEISFEQSKDSIVYRISDFDKKYKDILEMCYYEADDKTYIKKFPSNTKNINKIMSNYKENAQNMFNQLGYFRAIPWEKALLEFLKMVHLEGVDWWLVGSCAACLRGIPLNPHDVDIMIDSKDVDKINEIFQDHIVEPIIDTNGWLTKDFGVIFLHARIDIASDPQKCLDIPQPVDCGPYAKENLEVLSWNGFDIKVPPIELQLYVNKIRNRTERVNLIEKYISDQK